MPSKMKDIKKKLKFYESNPFKIHRPKNSKIVNFS